jgi:hypothetical protein
MCRHGSLGGLNQSGVVFYVLQVIPSIFVSESLLCIHWNVPDSYAAPSSYIIVVLVSYTTTAPHLYCLQVCWLVNYYFLYLCLPIKRKEPYKREIGSTIEHALKALLGVQKIYVTHIFHWILSIFFE